ncbi:hypothetical protein QUB05_24175 [Microcoleus sp. F10-C6]|uniref:hypothetical protein n=1 Tax=unclassified Microcoleus TaxID=2642155 RepID=UPI002FD233AD
MQIDPGLEYIYVWGAREHGKYGDWMGDRDRLASALEDVRTLVWWFESLSNAVE